MRVQVVDSQRSQSTGMIFDIQRFSLHDGPGIRTTVFLKGCPLHCLWCHNPESQDFLPEMAFNAASCINCGACVEVCPEGCHAVPAGVHRFDRARCTRCGLCADASCTGALERIGRTASVEEVMNDVLRDKPFYASSGGGMTLSGGEPLAQPEFCAALLRAAKREGLHTCVETSGAVPFSTFTDIMPFVDLFLYDIKETDPASLAQATGAKMDEVLGNLERLDDAGASIILRLPIIPGLNDREDHFLTLAHLAEKLRGIRGIDLLPYHPLGTGKLARIGKPDSFVSEAPSDATVERWLGTLHALLPTLPIRRG